MHVRCPSGEAVVFTKQQLIDQQNRSFYEHSVISSAVGGRPKTLGAFATLCPGYEIRGRP